MVVSGWASTVFGAARASPEKAIEPPTPKEPDWDRYFRALGDVDEPMPCRLMRAPSVESEPRTTILLDDGALEGFSEAGSDTSCGAEVFAPSPRGLGARKTAPPARSDAVFAPSPRALGAARPSPRREAPRGSFDEVNAARDRLEVHDVKTDERKEAEDAFAHCGPTIFEEDDAFAVPQNCASPLFGRLLSDAGLSDDGDAAAAPELEGRASPLFERLFSDDGDGDGARRPELEGRAIGCLGAAPPSPPRDDLLFEESGCSFAKDDEGLPNVGCLSRSPRPASPPAPPDAREYAATPPLIRKGGLSWSAPALGRGEPAPELDLSQPLEQLLESSKRRAEASQLDAWLERRGLGKYRAAIAELGARKVSDLAHLEQGDLDDMGMTPYERADVRISVG